MLLQSHTENFAGTDDLLLGLQLTRSGRFARPNQKARLEPMILYHHPLLEEIYKIDPGLQVLTDGEIDGLIKTSFTPPGEPMNWASTSWISSIAMDI